MKKFTFKGNRHSPSVVLDKEKGVFSFKGRSIVSNPTEFYEPIIDWFTEYVQSPNNNTVINVELDYFNSSSFKALVDIFKIISTIKNLEVVWSVYEDDDVIDEAHKIMDLTGISIKFDYIE